MYVEAGMFLKIIQSERQSRMKLRIPFAPIAPFLKTFYFYGDQIQFTWIGDLLWI